MNAKTTVWTAAVLAVLVSAGRTSAVAPGPVGQWGTDSSLGLADILDHGGQINPNSDFQGGLNVPTVASLVVDVRGLAQTEINIGAFGGSATGVLKAKTTLTGATSGEPNVVGASSDTFASVVDLFLYTGPSGPVSMDFTLHGVMVSNADGPTFYEEYILGEVAVFRAEGFVFGSTVGSIMENGATLMDEADMQMFGVNPPLGDTLNATLNFNLQNGEYFYVLQHIATAAHMGADLADAFSTLSGEFVNPELFIAHEFGPIPEPATASLLLLTAAAMLGRRRH